MIELAVLRHTIARPAIISLPAAGIAAIVVAGVLFRMAAMRQPAYDPLRDTISSLASHGAAQPWIGVLAIVTSGLAAMIASVSLRRVSQPGALALGASGMALMLVAFTRIACHGGAAGCEMGAGTDYATATAHTIGLVLFEVTLVTAIGSAAISLWRAGSRLASSAAVLGMVLSVLFFAVVPLDTGIRQRLWLLANAILIAGCLLAPLWARASAARHTRGRPRSVPGTG